MKQISVCSDCRIIFTIAVIMLIVSDTIGIPVSGTAAKFEGSVPQPFNRIHMAVTFSQGVSILNYGTSTPFTNSDYVSLVQKIHTKFDLIVYNWEESKVLPLSAARYNKLLWKANNTKSTSKSSVQIWLHVGYYFDNRAVGNTFKPETLEEVLKKADYANTIFSNTVPVISLQDKYIEDLSISKTYWNVLQASRLLRNNTKRNYKVAVRYEISKCSSNARLFAHESVKNFSNILIFHMFPQAIDYQNGVATFFHKVTNIFEECKLHFVRNKFYSKLSIRIAFQTTWADSYESSTEYAGIRENITSLAWFWKNINAWAVNSNNLVIMMRAFDIASWEKPLEWQTNGLWRLVENSSYGNAQEYKFEDKLDNLTDPVEKNARNNTWLQQKSDFSGGKLSVVLDPYISRFDSRDHYNLQTIPVMLEVISTEFSKITVDVTDKIKHQLPQIVAEYNKQTKGIRPFEVYVETFYAPTGTWSTRVSTRKAIAALEAANSIFPNTVQMLILKGSLFANQSISITKDQFEQIGSAITNASVKLGRLFPTAICSNDDFEKFIKPFLVPQKFLNAIVLKEYALHEKMRNLGPKRNLARNFALAEKCMARIKNISDAVDVVLKLGWSCEQGKEYELVWYWEQVSEWSTAKNISVIMSQAMDTRETFHGWWRLIEEAELKNPRDYTFENKREIAFRNAADHIKPHSEEQDPKTSNFVFPWVMAVCILGTIAILLIIGTLLWLRWMKKVKVVKLTEKDIDEFFDGAGNEKEKRGRYRKEFEIPFENITFGEVLGSGYFGVVHRAKFENNELIDAAVKLPIRETETLETFKSMLMEVKISCHVGVHENILKFLGACTHDIRNGMIYIVTELCENGSLLSFLREHKLKKTNITHYELFRFANEIAAGMKYLGEINIVHGDLSARNILLDGNFTCKVSDFGLSRKLDANGEYVKKGDGGAFPWRWMALESLRNKIFTAYSDVWSYGVTLWEIFTLGELPYKDVCLENFIQQLDKGMRLEHPVGTPQPVFDAMNNCWLEKVEERLTFQELVNIFGDLLKQEYDSPLSEYRIEP